MVQCPIISIVVLNWNTSDLLLGALQSIVDTAGDLDYEVVVIDNASTDGGLEKIVSKFETNPRFLFIQNEKNIGWAAINIMLEKARGKYIVTVDPDAVLHKDTLQILFAFMETHQKAGAVTAKLLNPDGSLQRYYRRIMTPSAYFFTTLIGRVFDKYFFRLRHFTHYRYENASFTEVTEVEQPAWPCLMWRREALGAYIVDTHIPFYFVDVDMSRRLYDRGYKIYLLPEATITHLKSTSFSKTKNKWRTQEYNRSLLYYFKKHYPVTFLFILLQQLIDGILRAGATLILGREPLR